MEAQSPMPLLTARDGGQGDVFDIGTCAVGRIRPGDDVAQMADDLPVRKDLLNLRGIFKSERAQEQAGGLAFRRHELMINNRNEAPGQVGIRDNGGRRRD